MRGLQVWDAFVEGLNLDPYRLQLRVVWKTTVRRLFPFVALSMTVTHSLQTTARNWSWLTRNYSFTLYMRDTVKPNRISKKVICASREDNRWTRWWQTNRNIELEYARSLSRSRPAIWRHIQNAHRIRYDRWLPASACIAKQIACNGESDGKFVPCTSIMLRMCMNARSSEKDEYGTSKRNFA